MLTAFSGYCKMVYLLECFPDHVNFTTSQMVPMEGSKVVIEPNIAITISVYLY